MAGVGSILKKLVGPQSMARQFFVWGVLQEVVSTALSPFIQILQHEVNSAFPENILSPAELADMTVRGIIGADWAEGEAKKGGYTPELFRLMVHNNGMPPSLLDMLQLMRRGKIDRDTVIRAIKQSRIKNEWIDTILLLGVQPPSPTEILKSYLQGQVDGDRAKELYTQLGGDPDFFQLLYDTEGAAPTPNEAAEMARKGIIPWDGTGAGVVSFHQAFLEGPWRNKWLEPWRKSAEYLPPPRTITAMLREGSLTVAEATDLLHKQGVPDNLIGTYLTDASTTKTAKAKELTESTIGALYQEHAIGDADAKGMLLKLRYTAHEADFVLMAWQMARELKYRNTAITTVHTQYINHKIEAGDVSLLLDRFGVSASQRDHLIALWTEEARAKVTLLTPAQIKTAGRKGFLEPDAAIARLLNLGYSQEDAEIFLSI